MMTIAPIRSPEHAADYLDGSDHADYYARDESCPSRFAGGGAEKLAVNEMRVTKPRLIRYLKGEIAGQKLGTTKNGVVERKAGDDCVLSPPKSVSLVALVGGDQRVIEAHEKAVDSAIKMMEEEAAYTRKHILDEFGRDEIYPLHTGKLLCAVYRHDTSRNLQPHLHSHVLVVNATELEPGVWRSIDSRHLYCIQMKVGLHYRQELAARLCALGYTLRRSQNGSFEIEEVPEEVISASSSRRDDIDVALEELGFDRKSASASLKERIARRLREKKQLVDRKELLDRWQKLEGDFQFDSRDVVRRALIRANQADFVSKEADKAFNKLEAIFEECSADLFERDSVVSRERLIDHVNQMAVGFGISSQAVQGYMDNAEARGFLLERTVKEYSTQFKEWRDVAGFTTSEIVARENSMLDCIGRSRGASNSLVSAPTVENYICKASTKSQNQGYSGWSLGQQTALRGMLLSQSSIVALQGLAGTAKTSTVLNELSQICTAQGYEVIGMAPSASACKSLKEGAGLETAVTVASHLLRSSFAKVPQQHQVWIVDEASLLSTRDMYSLITRAEKQKARLFLVGDVQQLGSVDAGAAFRQLQEFGVETFELDEILRQQNSSALSAVYAGIEGDAKKAMDLLQGEGGEVAQVAGDEAKRHKVIVDSWISLSPDDRESTLIIDPSRKGRKALSTRFREALKQEGVIGSDYIRVIQHESIDHTDSSRKDVFNYQVNDRILFGRDYKASGVARNSYWSVVARDTRKNTLTIVDESGRQIKWNPRGQWGARSQAFRPVDSQLSVHDKIVWTKNIRSKKLTNGMKGVVQSIDKNSRTAHILFANGKSVTIDLADSSSLHWSHDYVTTAHSAQGQTADRVIYHAESYRRNLASQKSFYVSISRAKHHTLVVTDDRDLLQQQIAEHTGEKQNAIEQTNGEVMGYG